MALTNDQITAQNFKDFYGQIRPYLNGQVPTFANQFSRSDLYSTDEKIIGSWTDGKPLYQKTITVTPPSNTISTEVQQDISSEIQGAEKIFLGNPSFLWRSNNSQAIPLLLGWVSTALGVIPNIENGTGKARLNWHGIPDYWEGTPAIITLQYTKTTDSAIKVGTGTDYSTDEQIIGSWIDGKPIYQKTFSGTVSSANNISYVSIGASVDTFVDGRGVLNNSVPLIGVSNDGVSAGVSTFVNSNSAASNKNTFGVYSKPESQSAWVGLSYYFTLCYTKTTD